MNRNYEPYIPDNIIYLKDFLAKIIVQSPKFIDTTGYFPDRNIDTIFYSLNGSLQLLQNKFGEENYLKLREMSDRARAHFESDPEDQAGGRRKGCAIIYEMEDLINKAARTRRGRTDTSDDFTT